MFDHDFEISILAFLKDQPDRFFDYKDLLDELQFSSKPTKLIYKVLKDRYDKYERSPTYAEAKACIRALTKRLDSEIIDAALEDLREVYKTQTTPTTDEFLCTWIRVKEQDAVAEALRRVEPDDEEEMARLRERLERLNDLGKTAGDDADIGTSVFSQGFVENWVANIRAIYEGDPIMTGISRLDSNSGGLFPGELAIFMAPSGFGKTMYLVNIAKNNVIDYGKRVVYIALDNLRAEIIQRFGCVVTEMAKEEILEDEEGFTVELMLRSGGTHDRLWVKDFPAYSLTPNGVSAYLRRLKKHLVKLDTEEGTDEEDAGRIDLLIVDYGDLLNPDVSSGLRMEMRHRFGMVYTQLTALAQRWKLPVWTATQSNRDALNQDVPGMQNIGESYLKLHPARIFVAMAQTTEQELADQWDLAALKVTRGRKNLLYPMGVNYEHQRIWERSGDVKVIERRRGRNASMSQDDMDKLGISEKQIKSLKELTAIDDMELELEMLLEGVV